MRARQMIQAVACVTIISAITRIIAFVFKIYLSRKLGAEILGVYQISMSIFLLFMAFASSGIPTALSRHLASLNASSDTHGARGMLTSALLLSGGISLCIIAICYLFPHITSLLFSDERCSEMFFIMLPALFSTSVYAIIRSYFWGGKMYTLYSLAEAVEEILSIIIVLSCIFLGLYHENMSKCVAVAFVISDYIGMFLLVTLFILKGGRLAKPTLMRPLVASSTPMTSTRLLGSLVSSSMALIIPMLLVKNGMDTSLATASYGRASGMVMSLVFTPSTIVGSLAIVMIPEIADKSVRDHTNIDKVILPAIDFSLIIACLFLSLFLSVGNNLCTFLYDDTIAGKYMPVACLVMLPMSINQIAVNILNTMGNENKTFITHLVCSFVLGALILILPKYMGIYAYFVGLIVFHSISCIVYLTMLRRYVTLPHDGILKGLYIIIFAVLVGFCLRLVANIIKNTFLEIVIFSLIILVMYYIFLNVTGILKINYIATKMLKKSHSH